MPNWAAAWPILNAGSLLFIGAKSPWIRERLVNKRLHRSFKIDQKMLQFDDGSSKNRRFAYDLPPVVAGVRRLGSFPFTTKCVGTMGTVGTRLASSLNEQVAVFPH